MVHAANLFLVGMMGAGKSTIGRLLARRMKRPFFDSDHEIERRCGVSVPVIFDIEGEPGFRAREAQVIAELTEREGIVLATGGGAVLDAESRRRLATRGTVVYLHAPPADLQDQYSQWLDAFQTTLSAEEQVSWRAWISANVLLQERLERDMKAQHGLSMAEYEVLVRLSEALSTLLKAHKYEQGGKTLTGIPHNVLNARYHEQEAYIVAQAGVPGVLQEEGVEGSVGLHPPERVVGFRGAAHLGQEAPGAGPGLG